jgi:hypothetical protein
VSHFEGVHEQDAVDRRIRQRQFGFVDESRERRPLGRPFHHPLRRRHEGEAALRVLTKQAEIRGRIADAEDAQPLAAVPQASDADADEASRHLAERVDVEAAEIDDVERHDLP